MPAISRIRFTNVIYENGGKRYNDMVFRFDGHNAALLLENGGGKTVFIQTALQAIIPHIDLADRKIKDTLNLENGPAHIAIEWVLNDSPRRYALTAVSLYNENNTLNSYKYVYEYSPDDQHAIDKIPYTIKNENGSLRAASKGEISEYYYRMKKNDMNADLFDTIKGYGEYIENKFKIIPSEWRSIAEINSGEGNVDEYFSKCKTTTQLLNNLLIPVVEEAIDGENSKQFVETFERQREHFKKNKMLQHQIYQSQMVRDKVNDYVLDYKAYGDSLSQYDNLRLDAKATYESIIDYQKITNEKLEHNQAVNASLQREEKELKRKELSYDIHKLKAGVHRLDDDKKSYETRYNESKDRLNRLLERKQNIAYTNNNEKIKKANENISHINNKLKAFDNTDTRELRGRFEENNSRLKGYFEKQLSLFNREIEDIREKINQYNQALLTQKADSKDLDMEEKRLNNEVTALETLITLKKKDIEELSKKINAESSDSYINHLEHLEKMREDIGFKLEVVIDKINDLKGKIRVLQEEKKINNEGIIRASSELDHHKLLLEEIDEVKNQLIHEIEIKGYFLSIGSSIYEKSESIIGSLLEKRDKLAGEKEKALQIERINKRSYDQYMDANEFSADTLVEKIVGNMNGVDFVQLGTTYIKTIVADKGYSEDLLFERYPLWPMTVVTTKDNVSKVEDSIRKKEDELQYPVIVMSTKEINQIIDEEMGNPFYDKGVKVYPHNWLSNLSEEGFSQWLDHAKLKGQKSEDLRKDIENKLAESNHLISKVNDFFSRHPRAKYRFIEDKIKELDHEVRQRKIRQGLNEREIEKYDNELALLIGEQEQDEECFKTILDAIKFTKECVDLERLIKHKYTELMHKKEQLENVLIHKKDVVNHINSLEDSLKEADKASYNYSTEVSKIKSNEIYQSLERVMAIDSDISYETLKRIRADLTDSLKGLNADRTLVEHELLKEQELIKDLEKDKLRKEKQAKFRLKLIESYYENEEDELIDRIEELEPKCRALLKEIRGLEDEGLKKKTLIEAKERELYKDFTSIHEFHSPLAMVEEFLSSEALRINERLNQVISEKQALDTKSRDYEKLIRDMDIKNGLYLYMDFDISHRVKEQILEENLKGAVKEIFENLDVLKTRCDLEAQKMAEKQSDFVEFCKENIDDIRLKEAAISGIKQKKNYDEILEYQNGIEERIERIVRLLEDDKKESDMELQTFLTHLHSYVKNVATELDMIQRKTSIKIDDSYKQIFIFDIPTWEEANGKEALREYINEIVEYFDRESDRGEYDEFTIRKEIENKLSVKNLLYVVMEGENIKVKCRKVTNDMKINKAPTSWESSNRWSGGEKWSKNMTLFLSILNYLSSKKQHLDIREKNNRTVILDNPFGKASSNHVLNPVFKIADKLGFQIIALTAHAEGKFISDYFPVVYSCRLRKARDGEKQVMSADKQINVAYLRENSPKSLVVLQDVEQLSLL